jgi:glucan 1,3-beta-glucosidase
LGLYDAYQRKAKFAWGGAVSNHPNWRWQAAGGIAFAALVFAAALGRRPAATAHRRGGFGRVWRERARVRVLIGWTVQNISIESLSAIDWIRSLSWATVAFAAPIAGAAALRQASRFPASQHARRAAPLFQTTRSPLRWVAC